ncbi:hypothetical protein RFI_33524, partial [Reticulomyxa filosa]
NPNIERLTFLTTSYDITIYWKYVKKSLDRASRMFVKKDQNDVVTVLLFFFFFLRERGGGKKVHFFQIVVPSFSFPSHKDIEPNDGTDAEKKQQEEKEKEKEQEKKEKEKSGDTARKPQLVDPALKDGRGKGQAHHLSWGGGVIPVEDIRHRWLYLKPYEPSFPPKFVVILLNGDELAQQITLMDFHIFNKIKPREFFRK